MVWKKCRPHEAPPNRLPPRRADWAHFLSVPGPIATQRHLHASIHVLNEPQCACRCQDQTKRVGAYNTLPLATLVLPEPIKGVLLRIAISTASGGHTRATWAASRSDPWRKRLRWLGAVFSVLAVEEWVRQVVAAPRPARGAQATPGPQAIPGLDLGARFAGAGCPSRGGLGQGLGRADQVAFFARGAASLGRGLGR